MIQRTQHTMTLLMAGMVFSMAGCCYYPAQPAESAAYSSVETTGTVDDPYSPYASYSPYSGSAVATPMEPVATTPPEPVAATPPEPVAVAPDTGMKQAAGLSESRYEAIEDNSSKSASGTGLSGEEYSAEPQPSDEIRYYDNLRTFQVVDQ